LTGRSIRNVQETIAPAAGTPFQEELSCPE